MDEENPKKMVDKGDSIFLKKWTLDTKETFLKAFIFDGVKGIPCSWTDAIFHLSFIIPLEPKGNNFSNRGYPPILQWN